LSHKTLTPAEATDRHGRLLLAAITLVAATSFSNAVEAVAEAPLVDYMKALQVLLVVAAFAALLPCAAWKFRTMRRLPEAERRQYFAPDSFMVHAFKHAKSASWIVALVLLILLGPVSERLPQVPAEFFFHLALGVMLGVFGIAGLILSR